MGGAQGWSWFWFNAGCLGCDARDKCNVKRQTRYRNQGARCWGQMSEDRMRGGVLESGAEEGL